jgi:tRNA threonylcarbamoyladenosine biosynthesis protein TsaB
MPEAILAIELSQRAGSVALRARTGSPVAERAVPPSDDSNDHLMAVIDELCRAHGVRPADLAAIAVGCGPGGFTGLRVACATAKAIADATGCALVAVPSALAVAHAAAHAGELPDAACTVVLASKAEDAWCTDVELDAAGVPRVVRAGLRGAADAGALRRPIVGDSHLLPAFGRAGSGGVLAARFSAAACLEVGESLLARGEKTEPLLLSPIYPRQAEAVTLWEARHGGGQGR